MICFYHKADLDGKCAGAIVKSEFQDDCELYGIDHGDPFPWKKIKDEVVIMVDFSLQPFDQMVRLQNESHRLIWIDHHESAIEAEREATPEPGEHIEGRRDIGLAGCELSWLFLRPHLDMPEAVRLLGRYDVWDHSDPLTMPFQFGLRTYDTDPNNQELWNDLFDGDNVPSIMDKVLAEGAAVLRYVENEYAAYAGRTAFETRFLGYSCIAMNRAIASSQLFESVYDPERHEIMLAFGLTGNGRWVISLYTTHEDIDVGRIARRKGGGGHPQAAGYLTAYNTDIMGIVLSRTA